MNTATKNIIRIGTLCAIVGALAIASITTVGALEGHSDTMPVPTKGLLVLSNVEVSPGDNISIWNGGEGSQCLPVADEEVYINIHVTRANTALYAGAYAFPIPDENGNWEIAVTVPETSYIPGVDVQGAWTVFATCSARGPGDVEDIHADTDYPLFSYPLASFEVVDDGVSPDTLDATNVAKPATKVMATPRFTG